MMSPKLLLSVSNEIKNVSKMVDVSLLQVKIFNFKNKARYE
jgi:hypothetical protein